MGFVLGVCFRFILFSVYFVSVFERSLHFALGDCEMRSSPTSASTRGRVLMESNLLVEKLPNNHESELHNSEVPCVMLERS